MANAAMTPQQVAEKWKRNLASAGESYKAGINAVTESPMEKAANAAELYAQQVRAAVDSGKFQASLRRVPLAVWKANSVSTGASRLTQVTPAAMTKMQNFMSQFLPFVQAGAQQVRSMAKGGIDNSIARAAAMIRHNASFQRS